MGFHRNPVPVISSSSLTTTLCLLLLSFLGVFGCSHSFHPIANGSHISQLPSDYRTASRIIWTNNEQMTDYLTSFYLENMLRVIEHRKAQRLFDEQQIILHHNTDDLEDMVKLGRMAGAGYVVFGDATIAVPRSAYVNSGYDVTVLVREISVETSQIMWAGQAKYPVAVPEPEQAVVNGTYWAIQVALCSAEKGSTWEQPPVGCKKQTDSSPESRLSVPRRDR